MIRFRDPRQKTMFDEVWDTMHPRLQQQCLNGWQHLLRNTILELLPVDRIGAGKSEDQGRPTTDLRAVGGLLILKSAFNWTFEQADQQFLSRLDVRWALGQALGDSIDERTLQRYNAVLQGDENACDEIFEKITDTLVEKLQISVRTQRLDSTHVLSDMAVLGRVMLFRRTISSLLRKIEKTDSEAFESIPTELRVRYIGANGKSIFGQKLKDDERQLVVQQAAKDMHFLMKQFAEHQTISGLKQYQTLAEVFSQQCDVNEQSVEVRRKTGGDVIQNPSDPDATYCGNKGVGYKAHLSETTNDVGEPNLVTSVHLAPACEHDSNALAPILEKLEERGQLPETLPADAGYGSDANVELAETKSVELVAPVPGGKQYDPEEVGYDQLSLNPDNTVKACAAGHAPKSSTFNAQSGTVFAQVDKNLCQSCPLLQRCPVQCNSSTQQPNGRISFHIGAVRAAQRRREEQTEEFKTKYRPRAGIESLNSALKRRMGLKRLRVRGKEAVKHAVTMTIVGWNILRAVAVCAFRSRKAKEAVVFG